MEENKNRLCNIFEDLKNLGYDGRIKSTESLSLAFLQSEPNLVFYEVATWLSFKLANILRLENCITVETEILDPEEKFSLEDSLPNLLAFYVEMSSVLKELKCPIKGLISGSLEHRLRDPINRIVAIEFMIQELQAAKIAHYKSRQTQKPVEVQLSESNTAKELKQMLIALSFSKPPKDIKASQLFKELEKRICTLSQPLSPTDKIGEILQVQNSLTENQWYSLERLYSDFFEEYKNRREMVIQRVSLTISSFFWSERIQKQEKLVQNINVIFSDFQQKAKAKPDVQVSDLICATADMAIAEHVSSSVACKNTHNQVTKVTIGEVPDRGGRPNEQAPPPPEVPSWKERSDARGGSAHFPKPNDSRGFGPQYNTPRGGRNQSHRPALFSMPVAGDNFAHFGGGPVLVGSVPVLMGVPPANFQCGQPVAPAFRGHQQHGRGFHFRPQRGRGKTSFGGFNSNNGLSG